MRRNMCTKRLHTSAHECTREDGMSSEAEWWYARKGLDRLCPVFLSRSSCGQKKTTLYIQRGLCFYSSVVSSLASCCQGVVRMRPPLFHCRGLALPVLST